MLTEFKNTHAMSAHATSDLLASLAARVLPVVREHETSVLVHSAWAGWHYETSADEAAAAGA